MSPSCERITGYHRDEFLNNPKLISEIVHQEDQSIIGEHFDIIDSDARDSVDFRIVTNTGEERWIEHMCQPVFDDDGEWLGRRVSNRDITKRKLAEKALRESEERFRLIFERHEGIMLLIEPESGSIVDANSAAAKYYGYPRETLFKMTIQDINCLPPDEVFVERQRAKLEQRNYFVFPHRLSTGEIRTVEVHSSPIEVQGRTLLFSIVHDITERKRAEDALSESELKYRLLFDNIPIGIILANTEGEILEVNRSLLEMLGSPGPEATKAINMLTFPPLVVAGISELFRTCMIEGKMIDTEVPYISKWGKKIFVRTILAPKFAAEGKVEGCLAVMEDITKRKQAEQEKESLQAQLLQAQKMEAVGTLAAGITHDFNNLLQVILGRSEMLLNYEQLGEKVRADLRQIVSAGRSGADLIQRLLIFCRKEETNFRSTDLNYQVEQLKKMLVRTFPKMIEIDLILAPKLATINADPTQMGQILMNVAVNARDSMPDGGKLSIQTENVILDEGYCSAHPGVQPGDYVLMTVSDTGCGMDKETLGRIFEPFFTTKEVGKGTGLGLSVVYQIVRRHGGHIYCYSEPGHGTTFKIYLPTILPKETVQEDTTEENALRGGTETVLLVDDEEPVREMIGQILSQAGYKVMTSCDGQKALDLYKL
ncbi:MAG: PAS domain S-box protein, partial [Deltaproteobacteria bacterium]|nr:PAS domain S-box protein [Deltaproteobacteria bacterium]